MFNPAEIKSNKFEGFSGNFLLKSDPFRPNCGLVTSWYVKTRGKGLMNSYLSYFIVK